MANIITLDGTDFSEFCLEIDNIDSFTYQLDDTNKIVTKSISSDFTFLGEAYEYLYDKFFSDASDCDALIEVGVTLDCCDGLELFYQITRKGVTNCPRECSIIAVIEKVNSDNIAFECLNRTRLFDGNFVANVTTPHLEYCTGEGFRGAGAILFAVLNFIFGIINVIILVINAIPLVPDIPIIGPEAIDGLLGCDRRAPGFVVKEALGFRASECGLDFQSTTILDIPQYQRTTVVAMSYVDGETNCPDYIKLFENRPNVNTISFIDSLLPVFGAECRIRNGVLIFETEKWVEDNLENVGNIENLIFDDDGICYEFDSNQASYGRFEYAYDAVDYWGNRVVDKYNEIVEWNPEGSLNKSGEYTHILDSFSPLNIIGMRPFEIGSPIAGILDHAVITGGIASHWKIYAWDGVATCKSKTVGNNWPFTFIQNQNNGFMDFPSLYDTFHYRKDPSNNPCPLKARDFTFMTDDFCGMIEKLEEFGTDIYLDSPHGKIKPSVVDVNMSTKTFTWQDTRIIKYD